MQVISRDDAQTQGLPRFLTGEPCRNGHSAERYVSSGVCVACMTMHNRGAILTRNTSPSVVRVAKSLEDAAIEVDGLSNRLRSLGQVVQADATSALALNLAKVCRSLTGQSSEGLEIFFGMGTPSTETASDVPAGDGAGHGMSWIKNL